MAKKPERLGDKPIEPAVRETMNKIAGVVDTALNMNMTEKRWGFCLMVFPLDGFDGRANYVSNAKRADVVTLLKEQLKRFEGQPEVKGKA